MSNLSTPLNNTLKVPQNRRIVLRKIKTKRLRFRTRFEGLLNLNLITPKKGHRFLFKLQLLRHQDQSPRHTKSLNHELKNPCIKVILIDCNSIMTQLTVFGRFKIALFPHILQDRGMFSSVKPKTHINAVHHVDFLLNTSDS